MDTTSHEVAEEMRCIAEFALEQRCLKIPFHGYAKKIISQGWRSLNQSQQEAFIKVAVPLTKRECRCCGNELEAGELLLGGKYCASCENRIAKDEAKLAREE
ncbi:hypothetical protein KL86DPRO_11340 [uncultured delta proteobacterium]|uniref:Uncharacterized protein n=1 Tax=uncultured delta proteobacterium TaxID=34034 RepID=A0A212JFE9_9DELT|nr:hypothetical protein KL86DPRO_11340 [uncultured delta proteobacterium]